MATLVWDKLDERLYQLGVDRGVLYLEDGTAVAWNGLTGVEESSDNEVKVFTLDGVRYLVNFTPGDFSAKLKAITYPDAFEDVNGIARPSPGFSFHNQPAKSFSLTYRTRVGNALEGHDFGYKIHILYNVIADPESIGYTTLQDSSVQPIELTWTLTGTPPKITGHRPTVHISIDSTKTPPEVLNLIESSLYGTEATSPILPSIEELAEYFGYLGALLIVDHGDGTWSAIDYSDTYISMVSDTEFQIDDADVVVVDPDTYQISSTNVSGSG